MAKVSKRLRYEILRRDNYTCRYCGRSAPDVVLTVDHVTPEALGGTNDPGNLVTACADCNNGKSSVPPDAPLVADVQQDAIRWKRAMAAAAEMRRLRREEQEAYAKYFEALWNDWGYGPKNNRKTIALPDDWHASLDNFFEYGLEPDDLAYAVRKAMSQRAVPHESMFRYFCGVCWNIIKDLQRVAGEIVTAELNDEINAEWPGGNP